MNEIVVFGEFDSDNLGDVLLGISQEYVYEMNGSVIELKTLSTSNIKINRKKIGEKKVIKVSSIKKIHRDFYFRSFLYRHIVDVLLFILKLKKIESDIQLKLFNCEKVIIGGGQLFSDNSLRMLLHIYIITKIAKKLKIKKYICGSGIPEPKTFISKLLMKKIFIHYKSKEVFVRDEKSIDVVNNITNLRLDSNNIIPDFVLSYLKDYESSKIESNLIGLSPISFECLSAKQRKYSYNQNQWWVDLAKYIQKSGYTPVLFCHGAKTDYERCKKIKELAYKQGINLELRARPEQVQSYIDMVKSFRNVLGQRLHVSITAFSLKLSPVSLPWDDKVKCFYNAAGLENNFITSGFNNFDMVLQLLLNNIETKGTLESLSWKTNKILSRVLHG